MVPRNLTEGAVREFQAIIKDSRDDGPKTARELQAKLLDRFKAIAEGRGFGHRRDDAPFDPRFRFLNVRPYPFVIIYDKETRVVLRIIHGARDFRNVTLDDG